ncbi:hypothetical protein [Deinococcus sp. Leaf326]|uniref:hypothetical protein n=1 Tax=Deinococcus sp. Leaf326 TaxID=1736338 RepID=UPI0006FAF1D1|nr:hypothetical protein [Deinococcus sp. Leaf326]KQR02421.1 hypothetical protein ASF71_21490 [Deinococcus sp. Leaf326]
MAGTSKIIPFVKTAPQSCQYCAWWSPQKYAAPVRGATTRAHGVPSGLGNCGRLRLLNLTITPANGLLATDMQPLPLTPSDFGCKQWDPKP